VFKNPDTKIILIVDDSEQMLTLMKLMLTRVGFHVIAARNAHETLRLLGEIKPDLIITDQMMPEVDGLELCREIRKRPGYAHTPILLRTHRMMDKPQIERALEAGANDVMHLLMLPTEFVGQVRKLLEASSNRLAD
jgi:DNA-binding response OmpR family regulator